MSDFFDRFLAALPEQIRKTYELDGRHDPLLFGLRGGRVLILTPIESDLLAPERKEMLCEVLRSVLKSSGCDGYAFIVESWLAKYRTPRRGSDDLPPSKHPERIDVITLYAASGSRRVFRAWEVDERARRVLEEVSGSDTATGGEIKGQFATLLEPSTLPGA